MDKEIKFYVENDGTTVFTGYKYGKTNFRSINSYNIFIEYKVVTYSYNYLDEHMDELEQEIRKEADGYKGARCEVDVEQNKGHIVLFCDNYDEIVEKYADDDAVYFENGDI